MNRKKHHSSAEDWVVKLDRGLTPEEQVAFEQLKRTDPEFSQKIESNRRAMTAIRDWTPDLPQDLLQDIEIGTRGKESWFSGFFSWKTGIVFSMGLACLFLISIWFALPSSEEDMVRLSQQEPPQTKRFEDGSIARLNSGSTLQYRYTDEVRLIHMVEGEAHFEVTKNEEIPFVVCVSNLRIRAVGTAFNVKIRDSEVDVIVTEGKIEIKNGNQVEDLSDDIDALSNGRFRNGETLGYLSVGERAEIRFERTTTEVDYMVSDPSSDMEDELKWQESLLTFNGPTLKDLTFEFEQKAGLKLIVRDPAIYNIRIVGGTFKSNDPFGILNLLKASYGIDWQQSKDGTIFLEYQNDL